MSIERILAANLAMDLPLLALAARASGVLNLRRLVLAGIAAAACGVMAVAAPFPWRAPPVRLAQAALLGRLLAGAHRRPLALRAAACLLGGAAFMAGWLQIAPAGGKLAAPVGFALLALTLSCSRMGRARWETEICLVFRGRQARFTALIDTGNRLREPFSGLPVMIVESRLVQDMLRDAPARILPFDAIGGSGALPCFRPDDVWCLSGRRRMRAPDLWIAVSPRPLPGGCSALAPFEFASLPLG